MDDKAIQAMLVAGCAHPRHHLSAALSARPVLGLTNAEIKAVLGRCGGTTTYSRNHFKTAREKLSATLREPSHG